MIIPAINAKTFEEAKKQLKKIETISATRVHFDIVDGKFASNTTWGSPEALQQLVIESALSMSNFEIHLMIENPEFAVDAWARCGVARIIVHAEAISDSEIIFDACREHNVEVMIAIGTDAQVEKLEPFFEKTHFFQILAVTPGKAGQTFDNKALEKIKLLKRKKTDAIIEVDGGINIETARACKGAGAHEFVSASYILESDDVSEAYDSLIQAVQ